MNPKLKLNAFNPATILNAALSTCFSIIFLFAFSTAQDKTQTDSGELYAGIELGTDGAIAIALRIPAGSESPGVKLVYSEAIHLSLSRSGQSGLPPHAVIDAASAVEKLFTRLREEYRVPEERIYLTGSSSLGAAHPQELVRTIRKATGRTLNFLDAFTEAQLSIVGTIPQRERSGEFWIDNRASSVLIEIVGDSTRGGYQLLKFSPPSPPGYEFVTMSVPYGVVNLAAETGGTAGENDDPLDFARRIQVEGSAVFRKSLQKSREEKPGLSTRKRVYLCGDIVRALATSLHPEERQTFVPLTAEDIAAFVKEARRDPVKLLNPNLSQLRSRELRREVEREMKSLRNSFTPQQIVAGAEMLRVAAEEFNWQQKSLLFARFGHLGRILSYVRLQAGK